MSSPAATVSAPANPRSRVILASLIGTSIEFYDFYVYATAAVLVGVETQNLKRAARACRYSADHAHRRRRARPIRPEEAEGLARRDLERDAVDRREIPVLLGQEMSSDDQSGYRDQP